MRPRTTDEIAAELDRLLRKEGENNEAAAEKIRAQGVEVSRDSVRRYRTKGAAKTIPADVLAAVALEWGVPLESLLYERKSTHEGAATNGEAPTSTDVEPVDERGEGELLSLLWTIQNAAGRGRALLEGRTTLPPFRSKASDERLWREFQEWKAQRDAGGEGGGDADSADG